MLALYSGLSEDLAAAVDKARSSIVCETVQFGHQTFTLSINNQHAGLSVCGLQETVVLSADLDHVMVFVTKQEDVQALTCSLVVHRALSDFLKSRHRTAGRGCRVSFCVLFKLSH